jgi:hypothetical protein
MQVAIEEFGAIDKDGLPILTDDSLWRTVRYCPPFYGITQKSSSNTGAGAYPGNQQTYGMWFTPPDIGVKLICFFISGDPEKGYYVGCIPEIGINHMIPAIGSASNYVTENITQESYFGQAPLLPVTEINTNNSGINNNPRFFDQPRPVHAYQASIFFQQGVDRDAERGPIGSSSQRETPSTVYGFSTPGQPIYEGGLQPNDIRKKLQSEELKPQDVKVIGRLGGHTLVMDDGDLESNNNLVRLRTSKGHQIMMNDSGNFFHIMHANGQTWLEFGSEGTVDVFSTNSINKTWLFRADLGDWVLLNPLVETDTNPYPTEFDQFFAMMLALRLAPRSGVELAATTQAYFNEVRKKFVSRYIQNAPLLADPSLTYTAIQGYDQWYAWRYGSTNAFNQGWGTWNGGQW